MTAPAYSTDLQIVTEAESATGWAELSGHTSGSAPAQDTEAYLQNTACVSQATGQAVGTTAGIQFDYGSDISLAAGDCFFVWQMFAAPNNIDTWANGGMRFGVGSSAGNIKFWNALGNDFGSYPYGGWQNTAIDPTFTADATEGTPAGTYRLFGSLPNMLNKITKGSPHCVDAIRYGRGEIVATGGDVSNGYCTFAGAAAVNDASANRWGLLQTRGGGNFLWKGLMSLGTSAAAVDFRDSYKTVVIDDTPRTYADFNRIEINNASSNVYWNSVTVSALGTLAKGNFAVVDNATVTLEGCSFSAMGAFEFLSNTSIDATIFRQCGQITLGAATLTNSTISNSYAATALLGEGNIGNLSDVDFISAGTGHAIELTSGTDHTLTNINFAGYAASNGSTGNEALYVNIASGTVNISVSGGNTPSFRTAGAAVNIITGQSTVTIEAAGGISLAGAEVRIYDLDGAGGTDYGTELAGTESNASSTFVFSGTSGNSVLIQIMQSGYVEFDQQYVIPSANSTFTALLVKEANA